MNIGTYGYGQTRNRRQNNFDTVVAATTTVRNVAHKVANYNRNRM